MSGKKQYNTTPPQMSAIDYVRRKKKHFRYNELIFNEMVRTIVLYKFAGSSLEWFAYLFFLPLHVVSNGGNRESASGHRLITAVDCSGQFVHPFVTAFRKYAGTDGLFAHFTSNSFRFAVQLKYFYSFLNVEINQYVFYLFFIS